MKIRLLFSLQTDQSRSQTTQNLVHTHRLGSRDESRVEGGPDSWPRKTGYAVLQCDNPLDTKGEVPN